MATVKKGLLVLVCTTLSLSAGLVLAQQKTQLEIEVEKATKRIQARQQKHDDNLKAIEKLRVEVKAYKPVKIEPAFKGIPPLPCQQRPKFWPKQDRNVVYQTCFYKYNLMDQKKIKSLYASIEQHTLDGWEIDQEDVEQDIISNEKVTNEHFIRFMKPKSNK